MSVSYALTEEGKLIATPGSPGQAEIRSNTTTGLPRDYMNVFQEVKDQYTSRLVNRSLIGMAPVRETVDFKLDNAIDPKTSPNEIAPMYLPLRKSDGTSLSASLSRSGNMVYITEGDKKFAWIEFDETNDPLFNPSFYPAIGKAYLTEQEDWTGKHTRIDIQMMITPSIGCYIESDFIGREELLHMARSMQVND